MSRCRDKNNSNRSAVLNWGVLKRSKNGGRERKGRECGVWEERGVKTDSRKWERETGTSALYGLEGAWMGFSLSRSWAATLRSQQEGSSDRAFCVARWDGKITRPGARPVSVVA